MIYVIDHEDSFTYNLVHLLEGFAPTYVSNYYNIKWRQLEKSKIIIFSPGPGNPSHYPETQKVYNKNLRGSAFYYKTRFLFFAMAIEDTINNVYGFQFHPDSFLTDDGKFLIQKVLQF